MRCRRKFGQLILATVCAAAWHGCAGGGDMGPDGGRPCNTPLDCDDGHACTIDSCDVNHRCIYDEIDEMCPDGQVCEAGRGCVSTASCSSDGDCDDSIECTIDRCQVGGLCAHTPVDARCGDGETCERTRGCVTPSGCSSDAECDDGIACTQDTCRADRTCSHVPLDELCDMAAGERCSPTSGCFRSMPCTTDDDCQDGNRCNGREFCMAEFGCMPAEEPFVCDDGNDCTIDRCDPSVPAGSDGQAGGCVYVCDSTRPECGCSGAPTCNGRFSLPGASGSCIRGFISWNFTDVTFTNTGGVIEVTGWSVESTSAAPEMADPGPACPSIDASTTIEGTCDETYRIQGTFIDDDTFMGTFSVTFSGECLDCTTRSISITGTRIGP